jgi:hypothetical protein
LPRRQGDGKAGPAVQPRAGDQLAAGVPGQQTGIGQSETKAAVAGPHLVFQAKEGIEDPFLFAGCDAEAGIPDLDAELPASAPAAQQHPALARELSGIVEQGGEDASEARRVAAHGGPGWHHPQAQTSLRQLRSMLRCQAGKDRLQQQILVVPAQQSLLRLVERGQRVQPGTGEPQGEIHVGQDGLPVAGGLRLAQFTQQQAEGIQRLAQLMLGSEKEAAWLTPVRPSQFLSPRRDSF